MVHDTGLSGSTGVSGMWIWEVGRGVWWGGVPRLCVPALGVLLVLVRSFSHPAAVQTSESPSEGTGSQRRSGG